MIENLPEKPREFVTDLQDFDVKKRSLHLFASAKNIDLLKELSIDNLWLIGAKDKDLEKILPMVNLKYLNLYHLLAKNLKILETQNKPEVIILNWNTKATTLWDISKNTNLKILEITDFPKVNEISQLSLATQIDQLSLSGGIGKPLKIKTLKPLESLKQLKYLSLTNLRLEDDTLKPLMELKNLKHLDLSNQFETKEYAFLAARLKNTICSMFQATNSCNISGTDNNIVWDTMVTGRRKPFLLSTKDSTKIDKYIKDFERLKTEFSE